MKNASLRLLKKLVEAQAVEAKAAEALEDDGIIRLAQSFVGSVELSDEEKRVLIGRIKPLLVSRELTKDEKDELARLFDRYRMRLWTKLSRSIGAGLEAKLEPDDVLSEAYIRAETRWTVRPEDPEKHYVWVYGIVQDQFRDMLRMVRADKRGGKAKHVSIHDNSAAEIALAFCQSQTGASTIAARKEFVSEIARVPGAESSAIELDIFLMRVFDRLEYPDIVTVLDYRANESDRVADYQTILADEGSRSQEGDGASKDVAKQRADAIRKRFNRAVGKLAGTIIAEFPELLDALPGLEPGTI